MDQLRTFNWRAFNNSELKRSFLRAIALIGDSGLSDPQKVYKWKRIKTEMSRIFALAKIKLNNTSNASIPLEPNITHLFQNIKDYNELANIWKLWSDASGKKYRHLYIDYVQLSNEATKDYGFKDYGEFTRASFETPDFAQKLDDLYFDLKKLYVLLHAYVKKRLSEMYPERIREELKELPAHLFGDLWAQQWHNIFEDIKPYKNKPLLDVTQNMINKVNPSSYFQINFFLIKSN
jgi:hypothetical protein